MSRRARDPALFSSIVLRVALPSLRGRHEIRSFVMASLGGRPTGQTTATRIQWRNWNTNLGAQILPRGEPFPDAVPPSGMPPRVGQWRCDPVNAFYVRRFLDLAASHGVLVYWLLPPVSPGTQAHWEHSGDESLYLGFIRSIQARYLDLVVIDGRHSGYDRSVFIDSVHLDRNGATGLSVGLANVLTRPGVKAGTALGAAADLPQPTRRRADRGRRTIPDRLKSG